MGHIPETDAAETELAIYGMRATTAAAARIPTNLELRGLLLLVDQSFFSHGSSRFLSEGEAESVEQSPAFGVVLGGRNKGDIHTPD